METVKPGQIAVFMRKFNFRGGRIRLIKFQTKKGVTNAKLGLAIKTPGGEVSRLLIEFIDVDEYRFQRRAYVKPRALSEVRLGYFDGAFYFNLDAFAEDGPAKVIDFRNSEAYIAAQGMQYKIV
jgi:hypothetical protein